MNGGSGFWVRLITGAVVLLVAVASIWFLTLRGRSKQEKIGVISPLPSQKEPEVANCLRIFDLVPGQPLQRASELFGAANYTDSSGAPEYIFHRWDLKGCELIIRSDSSDKMYNISIKYRGTLIETPDGVILGKDTPSDIVRKVGSRFIPDSERFFSGEGIWIYGFDVNPAPPQNWQIEYTFSLHEENPEHLKILQQEDPPTENVFRTVPVTTFTLKLPEEPRPRK